MDSKKVGDLIPLDADGEPFIFETDGVTPRLFNAEFNSGVVRGDVTGAVGTFSGKLSTNAVDAVSNLNLRHGSVAVSAGAFAAGPFVFEEGVPQRLLRLQFNTTAPGALFIRVCYRFGGVNPGENSVWLYRTDLYINGGRYFLQSIPGAPLSRKWQPYYTFSFDFVRAVDVGLQTIDFESWTDSWPGTPYGQVRDIWLVAEVIA